MEFKYPNLDHGQHAQLAGNSCEKRPLFFVLALEYGRQLLDHC